MNISWLIYWIYTVDYINGFFDMIMVVGTIGFFAWLIFHVVYACFVGSAIDINGKEYAKELKDCRNIIAKAVFPLFIIGWLGVIFVPTSKTIILIAASEIGQKIINNPKVQALADPSFELLQTWIKKELKDLNLQDKKEKKND